MNAFFSNKRILVTGGAGFIGSHLCHHLVQQGALVTVLDNLSTGTLDNVATIKDKITFMQGSITDYDTCLQATKNTSLVFHMAAFISVPQSLEDPLACYEVNVTGTANLLEACRQNKVERFVFSSSSAVYGNVEGICTEQTSCSPTSPYGFSKLIGEHYCRYYAQHSNVRTLCLRYFNVYGKRQNPKGAYAAVVAKFRHQLQHNLPVTIFGDGMQTRDFIAVEKVVEANAMLAQLPASAMTGDPYNVATGSSISLLDLFSLLQKEHPHSTSSLQLESARSGDIRHSVASCTKYTDALKGLFPQG
jgi:nucleoside-diphosphate-sugar epimerase